MSLMVTFMSLFTFLMETTLMETTLNTILKKHQEAGGNIITLLQDTQEAFGYVPKEGPPSGTRAFRASRCTVTMT